MADIPVLQLGSIVEIELLEEEPKKVYRSKVEDMTDKHLVIGMPISRGVVVPVAVGAPVRITYHDNNAIYCFEASVESRSSERTSTFSIGMPEDIKRTQRRNFVRLDVAVDLGFILINDDWDGSNKRIAANTRDISGGGLRFETNVELQVGGLIDINIYLPDGQIVNAVAKIVRVLPTGSTENSYSIGLQFNIIEESDRDKIIKFIFQKQREFRQKGLM